MVKLVNRAKMTVASGGAGDITLGTAVAGYQTFADAGISDTAILRYTIEDGDDWEIGTGVYTASGTTLVRTVTESSNSNAALTCSADAIIFVTLAAEDFSGNAAPIWTTTPPSTLDLANDGSTAVTIAGVAIDEFPVRYSWDGYSGTSLYDADSLPPQLASAPTFSGGTASLVGSSTESNSGSFNFRLKASDGVKTATAITAVNLAFGYGMSSASYDNLFFNTAGAVSQETTTQEISFNSDGTKMFMIGVGSKKIHQYSLTNGFSLSSSNVTYSNLSFSIASQDAYPRGLAFNSDGTKMFVTGAATSKVHEYSLTNGFSLSANNVSYNNVNFNFNSQDYGPKGIDFNSDGTKMFMIGSNQIVYQYSLTNGFSLSSGNVTYDNLSFDVSSQESAPTSLKFTPSGTKMFVTGASGKVHEYSLANEFSLSANNVSYNNVNFSISSQDSNPYGLAFNSDGTKMFVAGYAGGKVYQYTSIG